LEVMVTLIISPPLLIVPIELVPVKPLHEAQLILLQASLLKIGLTVGGDPLAEQLLDKQMKKL